MLLQIYFSMKKCKSDACIFAGRFASCRSDMCETAFPPVSLIACTVINVACLFVCV